jgi:hypothetical protein
MQSPSYACACESPPPPSTLNAWTSLYETWYAYHGNWAHLNGVLHKSLPSVCVSSCLSILSLQGNGSVNCIPHFIAKQRLDKHVSTQKNTGNIRRTLGRAIFYAVRVFWNESLWVCLCILQSFLENNSIKTVPRQRRMVGGVVFYALRVVSKESRRLLLHRPSCLNLSFKYDASALQLGISSRPFPKDFPTEVFMPLSCLHVHNAVHQSHVPLFDHPSKIIKMFEAPIIPACCYF